MVDTGVNATAAALLGLLHDGPMTGGQLMAESERRLGSYWSMTRSQVYRELPALAESGFVRLGKPGPRSSQPYAITPAGKRAFAKWLASDAGREALRNPVALRAAFGKHQSPNALATTYQQAIESHNEAIAAIREVVKSMRKEGENFDAAAQEFAIGYHKAAIAWLKTAPTK
jgi:DNA-binding PadR family transcriptional regulator